MALTVALFLTACEPAPTDAGFQRPPTKVAVAAAEMRQIKQELEAIGTTLANESVTITAKVTDTISAIHFDDGQLVKQNSILVELTNAEEAALLREAEANVEDAQLTYDRLDNLAQQGSVPQSQADEAKARLDGVQARRQSLLARLNDRLVLAPFDGLLGFRQVSNGTLLTPSTPITTLDDISIIKLDFSLAEVYLGVIQSGQKLVAHSPAFPDRSFDATVRAIGSRVDPVTRAATIRAIINNTDHALRPGMLLTLRITTSTRDALMIPGRALVQRGSQVYVFTVTDDRHAQLIPVKAGMQDGAWVEVTSGIELGQAVVTDGILKLRDGSPVELITTTAD